MLGYINRIALSVYAATASLVGTAGELVNLARERASRRLKFLATPDATLRHGARKLNGRRFKRSKFKPRTKARKAAAQRRGSGRTAARIARKVRRHG